MWVTSLYHMIRCVSQSINQTTEVVHTRTLIILFLFCAFYTYPIMKDKLLGGIIMLREKYESCKKFVEEHKSEIITGTVCVILTGTASVIGFKVFNDKLKDTNLKVAKNGNIARRALQLHLDKALIEKKDTVASIARLDPEVPINKFHLIPEREHKVENLDAFIEYVLKEISECED